MAAHCRSCGAPLATLFVDLGPSPISNAFRTTDELSEPETFYPLRAYYLLILPWNLMDEIMADCSFVREWGGKFIVPIPAPRVL